MPQIPSNLAIGHYVSAQDSLVMGKISITKIGLKFCTRMQLQQHPREVNSSPPSAAYMRR